MFQVEACSVLPVLAMDLHVHAFYMLRIIDVQYHKFAFFVCTKLSIYISIWTAMNNRFPKDNRSY